MNTFDADGRLAPGQNWFEQFEQKQQERFRPDDFVDAYHKTQRDMAATYSQGYRQPEQRDWGQTFSAGINMVPVVGGLKMWWEGGFSGKDMVTGQWLNRSAWETGLGVTLNFASAMPIGIMGQAAQQAALRSSAFTSSHLNWQTMNAVRGLPNGMRPNPSLYLSESYIETHLAQFENGVSKIAASAPTRSHVGPPSGTYVIPKHVADDLIHKSGGSVAALERHLGLPPGSLGKLPVRIDIPSPKGLRMPSGNEAGANPHWQPGGITHGRLPEAVIDQVPIDQIRVNPIFGK